MDSLDTQRGVYFDNKYSLPLSLLPGNERLARSSAVCEAKREGGLLLLACSTRLLLWLRVAVHPRPMPI